MEEQTAVGEVCPQGGEVHSEWRKREFYFVGRFNSIILSPGVFDRVLWLLSTIFRRREPIALETSWVVEKNLKKVKRSGRFRTERLIMLVKAVTDLDFSWKVLVVGPRNLSDLLLLWAHGWSRRNIVAVDLMSAFRPIRPMRVEKLEFEDGTFDLVFCSAVLRYVADKAQACGEMRRVLKPGGVLAACEVPMTFPGGYAEYARTLGSGTILFGEQTNRANCFWLVWKKQ